MNSRLKSRPGRGTWALFVASMLLVTSVDATAASTLTRSHRTGSNFMFVTDSAGNTVFRETVSFTTSGTEDLDDGGAANLAPPGTTVSGTFGSLQQSAYLPGETPIGGPFDGVWVDEGFAYVRAGQSGTEHNAAIGGATAFFASFTLDAPMRWVWSADQIVGTSSGDGVAQFFFGIYDADSENFDAVFERDLSGNFDLVDSANGVLPAGNFQVTISLFTNIDLELVAGSGDHSLYLDNGLFTLVPIPIPGACVLFASAVCGLLGASRMAPRAALGQAVSPHGR